MLHIGYLNLIYLVGRFPLGRALRSYCTGIRREAGIRYDP